MKLIFVLLELPQSHSNFVGSPLVLVEVVHQKGFNLLRKFAFLGLQGLPNAIQSALQHLFGVGGGVQQLPLSAVVLRLELHESVGRSFDFHAKLFGAFDEDWVGLGNGLYVMVAMQTGEVSVNTEAPSLTVQAEQ